VSVLACVSESAGRKGELIGQSPQCGICNLICAAPGLEKNSVTWVVHAREHKLKPKIEVWVVAPT
jgi:hypothetical protein